MRFWHLLLLLPLFLNCPKQLVPRVKKIEAIYLASLYDDIHKEKPLLAGINQAEGIKIGHLVTEPPFMQMLLGRLGFYELLNGTGLDFIIGDTLLLQTDYSNCFYIPTSMGYAIKNYKGIRFGILFKNKDSLTIDDEIKIALVKQRSDILWVIDKDFVNSPPMKINFHIKNHELTDTTITAIEVETDTELLKELQNFKSTLNELLNKKIYLENKKFDEYMLSKISLHENVDVILYPEGFFRKVTEYDSISIGEILNDVDWELKFAKSLTMTEKDISNFSKEKKYKVWRKSVMNNHILFPDEKGTYIFDLLFTL